MHKANAFFSLVCAVCTGYAGSSNVSEPPGFLALVPDFDPAQFKNPPSQFWPGYFWLWNEKLDERVLCEQLQDMSEHGARSVTMLPMPHGFRPQSTNNHMDPDYLTPDFFERVHLAVKEAERLGMNWWLYDEGGWPSGRALGKVVEGHPELQLQRLEAQEVNSVSGSYQVPADAFALIVEPGRKVFRPGETWTPGEGEKGSLFQITQAGVPDLLNPSAVQRFISLTHEGYKSVIGSSFGETVQFVFTDEPAVPPPDPGKSLTWTPGMESLWEQVYGEPIYSALPALLDKPGMDMTLEDQLQRVRFFDLWTARFRDSYFKTLRNRCRENGLASAGHLGGEDQTINAVVHGFGHVLRGLRYLDVPGVDLIWRQLFPGRENQHHFPLFAASVAHQNGTRYAFTESFAVYGNGITPEQMRWLTDYQYVRGLNLMVIGCYPLSTLDHHMTGERPHFGRCNPLWDHLNGYHAYVARLGYALSVGNPRIDTAVYYPVRDMWALGPEDGKKAAESHDRIVAELLAHQCGVDIIDDDLLSDPSTKVERGELSVGPMRYHTILVGEVSWMAPESWKKLQAFAASGGEVLCETHHPGTTGKPGHGDLDSMKIGTVEEIVSDATPLVKISPPDRGIRVLVRACGNGEVLFLFNEGNTIYSGEFPLPGKAIQRMDPLTGDVFSADLNGNAVRLELLPGESALFLITNDSLQDKNESEPSGEKIPLDSILTALPIRRFAVGDHDFMIEKLKEPGIPFEKAAKWKDWLGEDFSGEVDYAADFVLPAGWDKSPLRLSTGPVEYAATVFVDEKPIGSLLWQPWQLELPPLSSGSHQIVIRVANTLANELTSQRVEELWSQKKGDGWPSPYHVRALAFERESRGGGLAGPIVIQQISGGDRRP